jgi:hypothetical protein
VLIAAADIGSHNLQDHAVIASSTARTHQLRKVDALNLHHARSDVGDTAIACHDALLAVAQTQVKAAAPASATA